MPGWAWVVLVVGVPLVFGKAYDWNAKRKGHRPGTGQERPVDLTSYHQLPPPDVGQTGSGMG